MPRIATCTQTTYANGGPLGTLGVKAERGHFFGDRKDGSKVSLVNVADPNHPVVLTDLTPSSNWAQSHIRVVLPAPVGNPPYAIVVEVPGSTTCSPVQFQALAALCPVYTVQSATPTHATPQWGHPLRLTAGQVAGFGTFGIGSSVHLMQLNPADLTTAPVFLQDLTPPSAQWTATEIVTRSLSTTPLGSPGPLNAAPVYGIRVQVPSATCAPTPTAIVRPCATYSVTAQDGNNVLRWQGTIKLDALPGSSFGIRDADASVKLVRLVDLDLNDPANPPTGRELVDLTGSSQWTETQIVATLPPEPQGQDDGPPYGLVVQLSATTPESCPPQAISVAPECSRFETWAREAFRLNVPRPLLDVDETDGAQKGSLEAVRTGAVNPLTDLLNQSPDVIRFLFRLTDTNDIGQETNVVPEPSSSNVGPGAQPSTSPIAEFRVKPHLAPEGVDETVYRAHLDLTLDVPGCDGALQVPDLGALELRQKTMPIPSMALVYEHEKFGGEVMVLLPGETTVLSEGALAASGCDQSLRHWDDRNADELACVRTPVATRLGWTSNVLRAVYDKLGSAKVPGTLADGVPVPIDAVAFLAERIALDVQRASVVDATGLIPDLNEAVIWDFPVFGSTFNNKISSSVLIGFNPPVVTNGPTLVSAFSSSDLFYDFSGEEFACRFDNQAVKFGDVVAAQPVIGTDETWPGIAGPDRWITNSNEYLCIVGGGGWWFDSPGYQDEISSVRLGPVNRLPDDVSWPPPSP